MPRPRPPGASISTIQLLHLAASKADKTFAEHTDSITAREYEVLAAVALGDGVSQTDIMNNTGIDRSSTGALTDRLVRRGWLQRRRTRQDRRSYSIRLTQSGRDALAVAEPAARSTEKVLFGRLSAQQKAQLLEALRQIV
jgi:MarR family transcriptional regulator, temperature-dependent positive regulator of motility